jgi:predicted nucleic acid-binding protein
MPKKSVYVETSILSAYVDERDNIASRFQRRETMHWWRQERDHFRLFSSELALAELERAEFPGQRRAIKLTMSMPFLFVTDAVIGAGTYYVEHGAMPRGDIGDAYHLALASVHNIDFLLTWNCKHLANANKVEHLQALNLRLGLATPAILTPQMLMGEHDL